MNASYSRKNYLAYLTGRLIQILMGGWSIKGSLPDRNKYIIIPAHHTSNWDFMIALAARFILSLKARFFLKHSLFVGPLGWFMRKIGGIPIERSQSHNRVDQVVTKKLRKASPDRVVIQATSPQRACKTGSYK